MNRISIPSNKNSFLCAFFCLMAFLSGACQAERKAPYPSPSSPIPVWTDSPSDEILPGSQANAEATPLLPKALVSTNADSSGQIGRIIYTCSPELYRQLCLINPDSSGFQRLTHQPAHDEQPVISPDGKQVLFISDLNGIPEIYLRELSNGSERKLTDRLGQISTPDFSPDGVWVIFSLRTRKENWSLWKMPRHGSQPQPVLRFNGQASGPAFSPDGMWIAFTGVSGGVADIYLTDSDGNNLRKLTQNILGVDDELAWSADGNWLAFAAGPRGDMDLYLLSPWSGELQRLTFGGNNLGPDFSPDGGWITFSSSRDGDHEIFVMRVDGSQLTQLTDNHSDDWQPNWGQ